MANPDKPSAPSSSPKPPATEDAARTGHPPTQPTPGAPTEPARRDATPPPGGALDLSTADAARAQGDPQDIQALRAQIRETEAERDRLTGEVRAFREGTHPSLRARYADRVEGMPYASDVGDPSRPASPEGDMRRLRCATEITALLALHQGTLGGSGLNRPANANRYLLAARAAGDELCRAYGIATE